MSGSGDRGGGGGLAEDGMVVDHSSALASKSSEPWNWNGEGYLQKDPNFGISESFWNEVTLNEEDLSYMFDGATTPVKACGDLAYHASSSDNMSKEPKEPRESCSQAKRRRMLQFDSQAVDNSLCCDELPSAFLKSNERESSVEEIMPEAPQWMSGFSEDVSASSYEGLDQQLEGWITNCLNDDEMTFCPEDVNLSETSDVQINMTEFSNSQPARANNVVQQQEVTRTSRNNIIFKGRKSFIQTPTKLASSVAYPFAFIKPCGVHGDVTLKDINQRIHTPLKSKQNIEDISSFPTSAFSGKPVVGKTKIRTEGGKGSITIMRTKG